jgi:hypothetical protein
VPCRGLPFGEETKSIPRPSGRGTALRAYRMSIMLPIGLELKNRKKLDGT